MNLFRGQLALPLNLVSLPGRNGLNTGLTAVYDSAVGRQVRLRNRNAPTSSLGVGWSMGHERIVVEERGVALSDQQRFLLVDTNGVQPLYRVGEAEGRVSFQLREYRFWKIELVGVEDPESSHWVVVHEDGSTRTYGGPGAVEWGAEWEGWVGPSTAGGAAGFPVGWALAEVRSPQGDRLAYSYESDTVEIGGVPVTRAQRLARIDDPLGRSVELHYEAKEPFEVEPPALPPAGAPPAFQYQLETRYLDSIAVHEPSGAIDYRQRLGYELLDVTAPAGEARPPFTKRYLTEVRQEPADGRALPPLRFEYETDHTAASAGSMRGQLLPTGAAVGYGYEPAPIEHSSGAMELRGPAEHRPRVWHGADFTVVTWHNETSGRLEVWVCGWSGVWREWHDESLARRVIQDVSVHVGDGFFALRYRDVNAGVPRVRLYHEDPYRLGTWDSLDLSIGSGTAEMQMAIGRDFLALHAARAGSTTVVRWDALRKRWDEQLVATPAAAHVALGAGDGFFVGAFQAEGSEQVRLQVFFRDEEGVWGAGASSDVTLAVDWGVTRPESVWSVSSAFGAATFITSVEGEAVSAAVALLRWREDYQRAGIEVRPVSQSTDARNPILYSVIDDALVGHAADVLRLDAGRWEYLRLLEAKAGGEYRYAYGSDTALAAELREGLQTFTAQRYDPYSGRWLQEGAPAAPQRQGDLGLIGPAVSGDYAQLGAGLFSREPEGGWASIYRLPDSTIGPSCALRGDYFVYQRDEDPACEVLFLENGGVRGEPLRLPGERCYVPEAEAGEDLAGPATLVTYAGESFRSARTLTLHRVLDASMPETPSLPVLVEAEIDSGFGTRTVRFDYDEKGAAFDSTASTVQFTRVRVGWTSDPDAGSTRHTFYNGLEPDDEGAFYPPDGAWSNVRGYISLVNGQIWKSEALDAEGRLVSRVATYFWVYDRAAGPSGSVPAETIAAGESNLAGCYMRERRSERTFYLPATDAPEETTEVTWAETYEHNEYGQVAATVARGVGADGSEERFRTARTYAWEVYDGILDRHLLTPVAAVSRSNEGSGRVIGVDVTTYLDRWPSAGDRVLWAPRDSYSWRGTEETETFDFARWSNLEQPPQGWLRTGRVVDRSPAGNALEHVDVDGDSASTIFDRDDIFPVAGLSLTSRSAGEGWYWGFEEYEVPGPWTVSSPGAVEEGVAFAGRRCLHVPGAADAGSALSASFTATAETGSFLLACRACVPRRSEGGPVAAFWRCTAGGTSRELPLGEVDGGGSWRLWHVPLHPADFGLERFEMVQVELVNREPGVELLVDALFFNPLPGAGSASVYRLPHALVEATVDRLGPPRRTLFNDLRRAIAETGAEGVPRRLLVDHDWPETSSEFDPQAPSFTLDASIRAGGDSLDPRQGEGYLERWAQSGSWEIDGDALLHAGVDEGQLLTGWNRSEPTFAVRARLEPLEKQSRPFGLELGGARLVCREGRWVLLDQVGVELGSAPVADPPERDLLAIGSESGIEIFADGRLAIVAAAGEQPPGRLGAFADGEARVSKLIAAEGLAAAATFRDDTMRPLQEQALEAGATVTRVNLLDGSARPAAQTRPLEEKGRLLGFRDDLVATFDWVTGVLTGPVADAYPEDGGYPYGRTRFAPTPLGNIVETGLPGKELAIDERVPEPSRHTHRTLLQAARLAAGPISLPAGSFLVSGWVDQDGLRLRRASDPMGRPVLEVSDSAEDPSVPSEIRAWEYDDAGRLQALRLPNSFDASRPDASSFRQRFTHDFLGRLVKRERPDVEAPSETVYDAAGRVRFALDARGAAQGTFVCIRYDRLGRSLEDGVCTGAWDRALLESHAEERAWMPPGFEPLRVRRYDGDGDDPYAIGHLVEAVATDPGGGPTVTEGFRYDAEGRLVERSQEVAPVGATDLVRFAYDLHGNAVRQEHVGPDGTSFSIAAHFDDADRLRRLEGAVGEAPPETIARYTYNPEGQVATESLGAGSPAPLERDYRYGTAGWPTAIEDGAFVQELLREGSYAGRISGTRERFVEPPPVEGFLADFTTAVERDGHQRLRSVANSAGEEFGLGTSAPLTYDRNGNVLSFSRGAAVQRHVYAPGSDRLVEVAGAGSYRYDPEGGLSYVGPLGIEAIERHPESGMPLRIRRGAAGDVCFAYAADGARVFEEAPEATAVTAHDAGGRPFARRVRVGGKWQTVWYLHGPRGLAVAWAGSRRLLAIRDQLGSLRGLHDGGRLVAAASYEALGGALGPQWSDPTLAALLPQGFTGQPQGPPPGLVLFPLRLYDPFVGRFDRLDPSDRHPSPYAYAAGDPIDFLDPDGADALGALLGGIFATLVGVALVVASAGVATPWVAAALTVGGSALVGGGLASASYGGQHLSGGFNEGAWLGLSVLGGVFGAISGGLAAYSGAVAAGGEVAASKAFWYEVKVGIGLGGAEGFLSNGIVNSSNGRDFDQGLGWAVLTGAGFGALGGAAGGIWGRRLGYQNVVVLDRMDAAERRGGGFALGIHTTSKPGLGHSVVAVGQGADRRGYDLSVTPLADEAHVSVMALAKGERRAGFRRRGRGRWEQSFSGYGNVDQSAFLAARRQASKRMPHEADRPYSFISHSCTTDAIRVVETTGLRAPPWAYSPVTASLWMKLLPNLR